MSEAIFDALIDRLDHASETLRRGGDLLQAIARRYYMVYTYAVQAAERHGVAFRSGVTVDEERRVTHQALPDLVIALYEARNSGPVLGGGWGVTRKGRLELKSVHRYVSQLQKDRRYADYGHNAVREPYDVGTVDEHIRWANHLIDDLRSLL